jgi:hypothetical protein
MALLVGTWLGTRFAAGPGAWQLTGTFVFGLFFFLACLRLLGFYLVHPE